MQNTPWNFNEPAPVDLESQRTTVTVLTEAEMIKANLKEKKHRREMTLIITGIIAVAVVILVLSLLWPAVPRPKMEKKD